MEEDRKELERQNKLGKYKKIQKRKKVRIPAVLTEVVHVFLSSCRKIPGQYMELICDSFYLPS